MQCMLCLTLEHLIGRRIVSPSSCLSNSLPYYSYSYCLSYSYYHCFNDSFSNNLADSVTVSQQSALYVSIDHKSINHRVYQSSFPLRPFTHPSSTCVLPLFSSFFSPFPLLHLRLISLLFSAISSCSIILFLDLRPLNPLPLTISSFSPHILPFRSPLSQSVRMARV